MNVELQNTVKATTTPALVSTPVQNGLLQRKCSGCGTFSQDNERKEELEKRLSLQRRSTDDTKQAAIPPVVHEVLRSPGQPLDRGTCEFMEPRFGHDFSKVRVHTDEKAAESARAVNALAYTVGKDVVFGANEYAPGTMGGRRLLAHELTHVVQQGSQRNLQNKHEQEADRVAEQVMRMPEPQAISSGTPSIQRACPKCEEEELKRHSDKIDLLRTISEDEAVQCDEETKLLQSCGEVDMFTEIDLPFYMVYNNYYRNDISYGNEEETWKAALKKANKDKCLSEGSFENIKIEWDLNNPNLGKFLNMDLNKNNIEFDINAQAIYSGKTCCPCFTGEASWSLDVEITRKIGAKTEKGKTKDPIKGSVKGEDCSGTKCCDIDKTIKVDMSQGSWLISDLESKIKGEVKFKGATYGEPV